MRPTTRYYRLGSALHFKCTLLAIITAKLFRARWMHEKTREKSDLVCAIISAICYQTIRFSLDRIDTNDGQTSKLMAQIGLNLILICERVVGVCHCQWQQSAVTQKPNEGREQMYDKCSGPSKAPSRCCPNPPYQPLANKLSLQLALGTERLSGSQSECTHMTPMMIKSWESTFGAYKVHYYEGKDLINRHH